jgi:hypothetical protein
VSIPSVASDSKTRCSSRQRTARSAQPVDQAAELDVRLDHAEHDAGSGEFARGGARPTRGLGIRPGSSLELRNADADAPGLSPPALDAREPAARAPGIDLFRGQPSLSEPADPAPRRVVLVEDAEHSLDRVVVAPRSRLPLEARDGGILTGGFPRAHDAVEVPELVRDAEQRHREHWEGLAVTARNPLEDRQEGAHRGTSLCEVGVIEGRECTFQVVARVVLEGDAAALQAESGRHVAAAGGHCVEYRGVERKLEAEGVVGHLHRVEPEVSEAELVATELPPARHSGVQARGQIGLDHLEGLGLVHGRGDGGELPACEQEREVRKHALREKPLEETRVEAVEVHQMDVADLRVRALAREEGERFSWPEGRRRRAGLELRRAQGRSTRFFGRLRSVRAGRDGQEQPESQGAGRALDRTQQLRVAAPEPIE